jgi:CRISPR-associated protein Cas6
MQTVDVAFRVQGTAVPHDHGYVLFSAISRLIPGLHDADWLGIHPISGATRSPDGLRLKDHARLMLRMPITELGFVAALAGSSLRIGPNLLRVADSPSVHFLTPAGSMSARLVLIRHRPSRFKLASNELPGPALFETFLVEARRQLSTIGVRGEVEIAGVKRIVVNGHKLVGYSVRVSALSDADSLVLQEKGLGGKRHMGCGLFRPTRVRA